MSPILVAELTIAMRFIFAGCCARAMIGHTIDAAPLSTVMNSRRRMSPPENAPCPLSKA
jgi:hypothetical protein